MKSIILRVCVTGKAVRLWAILLSFVAMSSAGLMVPVLVSAQGNEDEGLSLQVSPSPLLATLKPGEEKSLELRIRNTGSRTQALKMELRNFKVDNETGEVKLQQDAPKDIASFVTFESPTFSIEPGQIFTQRVSIKTPESAGFTYSFATVISQQDPQKSPNSTASIRGTVAVSTLLDVDKPGAKRELALEKFSVNKRVYEYLPATIDLVIKNTGNTLAQPKGTVYVQRNSSDTEPISALTVNQSGGFILPDTSRKVTVSWNEGFPKYVDNKDDSSKQSLSWAGGDVSKFRIGKYVAKILVVYNDGQRDVPLEAEVTFWVIPWRILLGVFIVVALILVGVYTTVRKSSALVGLKHLKKRKATRNQDGDES